MSTFLDFLDLVNNEVSSLIDICPAYVQAIFYVACVMSIVLAIKRAVIG